MLLVRVELIAVVWSSRNFKASSALSATRLIKTVLEFRPARRPIPEASILRSAGVLYMQRLNAPVPVDSYPWPYRLVRNSIYTEERDFTKERRWPFPVAKVYQPDIETFVGCV